MNAPSLQRRIRNGTLLMLALVVLLGLYTLPRVYRLGGAIRQTLYKNYVSIEAAQNMHAALNTLQVAEHDGKTKDVLPGARQNFLQWDDVENHNFTEVGEPELAADISRRANKLFTDVSTAPPGTYQDLEFAELHGKLDDLIAMNKAAMFRADSRSVQLGKHLAYEFAGGLVLVLLVGAAVSWGLGWRLSKPLTELTDRLRGISQRKSQVRLGPQPLAELEAVAREFNQMAERLEQYDKLNVERLVYEKSKTEAIIESLEDGVVLIDTEGIVAHINEIASLILGVDLQDALGSPFDDLSSNHPHYLRVRDALRTLQRAGPGTNGHRTEIDLHVRGREHSYVLKPVPLHHTVGKSLGTLLILQDVTYIRDQDRARTNLVATLSHELRTPLTSLALSAELLSREDVERSAKGGELLQVILEECTRMRQLTDNLLNLARGEVPAIAVQQKRLDLARLAADVTRRFAIQAREKHVEIEEHIG
jgi:NtrC-family two-component system sensor histidine kinase KinB